MNKPLIVDASWSKKCTVLTIRCVCGWQKHQPSVWGKFICGGCGIKWNVHLIKEYPCPLGKIGGKKRGGCNEC
jgi:hypothetical protein